MTNPAAEEILSTDERDVTGIRMAKEPARSEELDVLFRRHYTGLLRLAVVMLGNREAAEDAVQDASFRLLVQSIRSPKPTGKAQASSRMSLSPQTKR